MDVKELVRSAYALMVSFFSIGVQEETVFSEPLFEAKAPWSDGIEKNYVSPETGIYFKIWLSVGVTTRAVAQKVFPHAYTLDEIMEHIKETEFTLRALPNLYNMLREYFEALGLEEVKCEGNMSGEETVYRLPDGAELAVRIDFDDDIVEVEA